MINPNSIAERLATAMECIEAWANRLHECAECDCGNCLIVADEMTDFEGRMTW